MDKLPPAYGTEQWWKEATVRVDDYQQAIMFYALRWQGVDCERLADYVKYLPPGKTIAACMAMKNPRNYDRAYDKFQTISKQTGVDRKDISLLVGDLLNGRIPTGCLHQPK